MMSKTIRQWASLIVAVILVAGAAGAKAEEEVRLKLDLDYDVRGGASRGLSLRPMVRTEQRFRDSGLVMLKVFAGARAGLLPWLLLQTYYAHKDNVASGDDVVHMLVLDLVAHTRIGPCVISDRNGNEWHSKPGFYRYRNNLDLHVNPGLHWLRMFVADEVRFDSDQTRMNMNDLTAGLDFKLARKLTLRTYYDLESKRRSSPDWRVTHVLGLMAISRM